MVEQLITEKDILDYLMTSDFNEGLTQEESKFLLLKYRNYYRIIHSKCENLKNTIDDLSKSIDKKNIEINNIMEKNNEMEKSLIVEKNRKLSSKERFFGKKIIKNK